MDLHLEDDVVVAFVLSVPLLATSLYPCSWFTHFQLHCSLCALTRTLSLPPSRLPYSRCPSPSGPLTGYGVLSPMTLSPSYGYSS